MTCASEGCRSAGYAKGLCKSHYGKARYKEQAEILRPAFAARMREKRSDPAFRAESNRKTQEYLTNYRKRPEVIARAKAYMADYSKIWAPSNKEKVASYSRKHRTGFTLGLTAALREYQSGLCAICAVEMELAGLGPDRECADHCHEKKRPRGFLCNSCNGALGRYETHQKPAGLWIEPYEVYLQNPPADLFL